MLITSLLFSMAIAVAGPAIQQTDCAARPDACRVVTGAELRIGDKTVPLTSGEAVPWLLQDGSLFLMPGESVVLDVRSGDKPQVLSSSAANTVITDPLSGRMISLMAGQGDEPRMHNTEMGLEGPADRLRVTFRQAADSDQTLLVIENGYDGPVTYRALMRVLTRDGTRWEQTSVCTVLPGIFSVEHWPHPIVSIALKDFTITPSLGEGNDEVVCR